MNNDYKRVYDKSFYGNHAAGMSSSAEVILGLIYNIYTPKSVVDIGCGQGVWLNMAESLGAITLKGFDGDWIKEEDLFSKNIDFLPVNLSESLPKLNEKYDLCISLEVAEHLPEDKAEGFIDLLCEASNTILFGAAIKHQGGTNHINEQWQTYWIKLFESRGYECVDCIRGTTWSDASVEWWYKQNTFIFIKSNSLGVRTKEFKGLEKPIFDVAHPSNYENKVYAISNPTLRFCVGCIIRWFSINFRKIVGLGA